MTAIELIALRDDAGQEGCVRPSFEDAAPASAAFSRLKTVQ